MINLSTLLCLLLATASAVVSRKLIPSITIIYQLYRQYIQHCLHKGQTSFIVTAFNDLFRT